MSYISELSPDGGTTNYDLKDKNAQTKNLTSPITVGGTPKTTVEGCLEALAQTGGTGAYVTDNVLYLPTDKASITGKRLIIT